MITVQNISLYHKGIPILREISCTFSAGTSTAIIGSNGSGKSTLLKIIVGQIRANSGSISRPTRVSYVPENLSFPSTTTADILRDNNKNIQFRCDALRFSMYQKIPYSKLSKGTQQKLHLLYSLSQETGVYIWDEPTQYLDPPSRRIVHSIINNIKQAGGICIYTTHFLDDIGEHTDACLLLKNTYCYPLSPEHARSIRD